MTSSDDAGINTALLAALPASAKILELGCADGRLGERYKLHHPSATWIGADINAGSLSVARTRLNDAIELDLDADSIAERAGTGFDLIVLGDVLEHLKRPERLLRELLGVCAPDARLVLCMPNMSHVSVIERQLFGDIVYDDVGLLDRTHVRFFSPRSVFKMLLDCGWLPNAAGGYEIPPANARLGRLLLEAADALGISRQAARDNMYTYQLIVSCTPARERAGPRAAHPPDLTVVVPVDNEALFSLNAARSPGLAELGVEVKAVRGVESAASALGAARAGSGSEWFLFCAQDVYVPRGSGDLIAQLLQAVPAEQARGSVIGFAGVGFDAAGRPLRSGLMVDRRTLWDFPASSGVASIADCAVILHRDAVPLVDAELDFTFWATDLCLQARQASPPRDVRVTRIPIFHNSAEDGSFGERYLLSAMHLRAKYPHLPGIATLRAHILPGRIDKMEYDAGP